MYVLQAFTLRLRRKSKCGRLRPKGRRRDNGWSARAGGRRFASPCITSETTVEPRGAMIVKDGTEVARVREKRMVC